MPHAFDYFCSRGFFDAAEVEWGLVRMHPRRKKKVEEACRALLSRLQTLGDRRKDRLTCWSLPCGKISPQACPSRGNRRGFASFAACRSGSWLVVRVQFAMKIFSPSSPPGPMQALWSSCFRGCKPRATASSAFARFLLLHHVLARLAMLRSPQPAWSGA
jgi:hypothetical protein